MLHHDFLLTALLGCIIGLSSGLFGIGGALIGTPLLRVVLDLQPLLALATPLPVAVPSAVSGTAAYYRYGFIDFRSSKYVLLGAIPANILGMLATRYISPIFLMIMTGTFLLVVGIQFFIRGWLLKEEPHHAERGSTFFFFLTGVVTGFLSGLLAIGGGIMMVPAFIRINKMRLKRALATSLFCVAILAIPSSIGHFLLGNIDIATACILAIPAVPLSYLGARIAIAIQGKMLERIYGTFIVLFALYFLYTQFEHGFRV